MLKKIFILSLFIFNYVSAQTGERWTLKNSNDGVNIYTQDFKDSNVKAIKVECQLEATLSQLVAALVDVKNSEDWLYRTSSNYVVKQVSASELYYYSKVEMPWPLSDRDFVAHLKVSQDALTRVVTIDTPCIPGMVPVNPKIVRISNSKGKWVISRAGNSRVNVVYTLHADPGGSIPPWLINLFVTQGPSQTFKMLKVYLQKPVYKSARLSYIVD